jgi:uncharacterized membrane protein YczE
MDDFITAPTNFDRFKIGAIIALIAIAEFIGLFVWLSLTPEQINQYYAIAPPY